MRTLFALLLNFSNFFLNSPFRDYHLENSSELLFRSWLGSSIYCSTFVFHISIHMPPPSMRKTGNLSIQIHQCVSSSKILKTCPSFVQSSEVVFPNFLKNRQVFFFSFFHISTLISSFNTKEKELEFISATSLPESQRKHAAFLSLVSYIRSLNSSKTANQFEISVYPPQLVCFWTLKAAKCSNVFALAKERFFVNLEKFYVYSSIWVSSDSEIFRFSFRRNTSLLIRKFSFDFMVSLAAVCRFCEIASI